MRKRSAKKLDREFDSLIAQYGHATLSRAWDRVVDEFQRYVDDGCASWDWHPSNMLEMFFEQNRRMPEDEVALYRASYRYKVHKDL